MVNIKQVTLTKYTPFTPKALPNNPLKIAAKKGKNTIVKYIILYIHYNQISNPKNPNTTIYIYNPKVILLLKSLLYYN